MQDLQADKKPIYEYDSFEIIEDIFKQSNNQAYKTEFIEQIKTVLTRQKKDFEEVIENAKNELYSRKTRFAELAKACNSLYYNKILNEDTSVKKIELIEVWKRKKLDKELENSELTEHEKKNKITEFWSGNVYFNAIVCIQFLQHQLILINELSINKLPALPNEEESKGLTERQSIILLRYLFEYKIFMPEIVSTDQTKQAALIRAIRGGGSNTYKYWNRIGDPKYDNEFYNTINLEAILKALEALKHTVNNTLIIKITQDLNDAKVRKINGLGT